MRKILLLLIVFLTATGLALAWAGTGTLPPGWRRALSLGHLWGGWLFLVVFPLYAWDHVSAHRRWLRGLTWMTVSGATQLASGVLLIASGVLLWLYGQNAWALLRQGHHWLTYLLVAVLVVHFVSPKRLPPRLRYTARGRP